MNLRQASLLAIVLATASAQTNQTAFYHKFLGCSKAGNYYCSDGSCYSTAPSGVVCSRNFTQDYTNPVYPATYTHSHNLNHLEIHELAVAAPGQTWLSLKQGESVQLNLKSTAEKSSYIEIEYNDVAATGSTNVNKTINQNVLFYVFNNRLKGVRTFDMTNVDKVLLPVSADDFTVYLAASNADFNITILASQSVFGRALSFALSIIALAAFAL